MAAVEAILFACGEPIELDKLAAAAELEKELAERMVNRLNSRYNDEKSAFTIKKLDGSYQMTTRPEFARYIKSALETKRQTPLTPAAMEVLSIVAYNQPVTRGFIDRVRGVDSSGVVRSLLDRGLLEEHGRLKDVPGHPIAYRTTENFLLCFGLGSLENLPPIPGSSEQISLDEIEEYGADYIPVDDEDPENDSDPEEDT